MKIFLVYLALNDWQAPKYSYGLGYISSVLKEKGYSVNQFTLSNKNDLKILKNRIISEKPQLIGFSATSSQFNQLKLILPEIRKVTKSFLVCGGVHTTLKPEDIHKITEIDAIIRGEGEYPMLELANSLKKGKLNTKIKSIWFRKNGKIIQNPVRPLIENLDTLPFPDKKLINYQELINDCNGLARFIFSRGCTFKCTYCSNLALSKIYPNKPRYFRQLSPERAIEEIKQDLREFNIRRLSFDDDTFSLNKNWFYKFLNLYSKEIKLPFECNIRIGTVNEDMLRTLKQSGATNIKIGVEHGNENFRKEVLGRNITNQEIIQIVNICKKINLPYTLFLMVGLPGENPRLFQDTISLSKKTGGEFDLSIFQPYPGTKLYEKCKDQITSIPQNFLERRTAVINYENFTKKEIQKSFDTFNRRVYGRKYYLKSAQTKIDRNLGKIGKVVKRILSNIEEKRDSKNPFYKISAKTKDRFWNLKRLNSNLISEISFAIKIRDLKKEKQNSYPVTPTKKMKINLVYFSCKNHFNILFDSLKSLEKLNSKNLGKVYLCIDRKDKLTSSQTSEIKKLNLNTRILLSKYKLSTRGHSNLMSEIIAFNQISREISQEDYLAKVDSDVLFISERIFQEVIASNFEVIGDNWAMPCIPNFFPNGFMQGGMYFVKNSTVSKLNTLNLRNSIKEIKNAFNISLEECSEDFVMSHLFRKISGNINFAHYILQFDRFNPSLEKIFSAIRKNKGKYSIIHLWGGEKGPRKYWQEINELIQKAR